MAIVEENKLNSVSMLTDDKANLDIFTYASVKMPGNGTSGTGRRDFINSSSTTLNFIDSSRQVQFSQLCFAGNEQ